MGEGITGFMVVRGVYFVCFIAFCIALREKIEELIFTVTISLLRLFFLVFQLMQLRTKKL